MKRKGQIVRRHEVTDPNPITLPLKFQKPPTLAEQIARFMAGAQRYDQEGEESLEEAEDFGDEDSDDHVESPHELVFDPLINREVPRFEYEMLAKGRAKYDEELQRQIRADKERAANEARWKAEADARRKKSGKKKAPPAGDAEDSTEE